MKRYEEAVETGASCIAVGCPFCLTMMTDASKEAGETGLEDKDIAEIVAETIRCQGIGDRRKQTGHPFHIIPDLYDTNTRSARGSKRVVIS
jgi:hypothetical protein